MPVAAASAVVAGHAASGRLTSTRDEEAASPPPHLASLVPNSASQTSLHPPHSYPAGARKRPASLVSVQQQDQEPPFSTNSPTSPHFQTYRSQYYISDSGDEDDQYTQAILPRNLDENPHGHTPQIPEAQHFTTALQVQTNSNFLQPQERGRQSESDDTTLSRPRLDRSATSFHTAPDSVSDYDNSDPHHADDELPVNMPQKYPILSVNVDPTTSQPSSSSKDNLKNVKSPKLGGFFGWRKGSTNNNHPDSPTTTFSDSRSVSPSGPLQSPLPPLAQSNGASPKDDGDYFVGTDSYYGHTITPGRDGPQHDLNHVDELLRELKEVSTELAASIAREMELEDEIDRSKSDMSTGPIELTRRTSDYFSDSGASSTKAPVANTETKLEALEKMRRKAEQDKAQLRLEMSQRAQEDLNTRRALELHVQSLEEQLRTHQRKLGEERQFKENFEDLMAGMRQEIESHRNERDNLRDEVVPQLRSRLEGLESEAADKSTLAYEISRMQQENQSLRNENQTLANARRLQLDMQQNNPRFRSIAEDGEGDSPRSPNPAMNLSRTNSLARSRSIKRLSGSQNRGKDGLTPIDGVQDSFKDLEDQRDALHRTLKALILRQDVMTKDHQKRLVVLQAERDTAMTDSRRRAESRFDTQRLRNEMNHLRRRADDAMEQKWQCEKGLSGLKMDLDRAQQETSSLRDLLQENDQSSVDANDSDQALATAYNVLRTLHADSISRVTRSANPDDAHTASLLQSSATRMAALSRQIEDQLATNAGLHTRLAEAIDRGVAEQSASAQAITALETALQAAEERVHAATGDSEEAVARQEEFVRGLRESAEEQARRGVAKPALKPAGQLLGLGLGLSTTTHTPSGMLSVPLLGAASPSASGKQKSPLLLFAGNRSPRLNKTTSGKGVGLAEASRTAALETRVGELERAALGADREMQGVVEVMNRAQGAVARLQAERDEATRQTRRLQRKIVEERERIRAMGVA